MAIQKTSSPRKQRNYAAIAAIDRAFLFVVYAAAAIFVFLVVMLFVQLVKGSWPSLQAFGAKFLWTSDWNPVTNSFGALPMIYGTVVSSLIAILLAGFVGVLAAAYLAEFAPRWLARPLGFVIELLAAVPSVIFGLWGLFVLSPAVRNQLAPFLQHTLGFLPIFSGPITVGTTLLTAGLILALMILPTVTAISREVIVAIGTDLREASMSLGATKWETVARVVLPASTVGIFGAIVLALGRALGETIATTMVIGNKAQIAVSLFAPAYTLASVIANEFTEANGDVYISALIELGLLLFLVSFAVNGLARLLLWTVMKERR
ncbi:MAG: phosphate ABC transporter permease subunit PstC [Candidatus Eremiobacteraeota bacterium]|nr:phosphate ABC transporter permease subunit PstC [Candidatus Eremiobacteraeota bacterium]